MPAATLPIDDQTILRRVRDLRASWSPNERRRRGMEGRHRFRKFLELMAGEVDPKSWTGGGRE